MTSSLLLELIDVVSQQMQRFPDDRTVVLCRFAQLGGQERQFLPDLLGDFCLDFGICHTSVSPFVAGIRFELEPSLEAFISQRSPKTEAAHRRQVERAWMTGNMEMNESRSINEPNRVQFPVTRSPARTRPTQRPRLRSNDMKRVSPVVAQNVRCRAFSASPTKNTIVSSRHDYCLTKYSVSTKGGFSPGTLGSILNLDSMLLPSAERVTWFSATVLPVVLGNSDGEGKSPAP